MNKFKIRMYEAGGYHSDAYRDYTLDSEKSLEEFCRGIHANGLIVDWAGRWSSGTVKRWWSPASVVWIEEEP